MSQELLTLSCSQINRITRDNTVMVNRNTLFWWAATAKTHSLSAKNRQFTVDYYKKIDMSGKYVSPIVFDQWMFKRWKSTQLTFLLSLNVKKKLLSEVGFEHMPPWGDQNTVLWKVLILEYGTLDCSVIMEITWRPEHSASWKVKSLEPGSLDHLAILTYNSVFFSP